MMETWLGLIGQAVILAIALIGLWRSLASQIQELHISLNSRLTELIVAVRGEADATGHARGLAEGRAERYDEDDG
jgi:hypothetical protein